MSDYHTSFPVSPGEDICPAGASWVADRIPGTESERGERQAGERASAEVYIYRVVLLLK